MIIGSIDIIYILLNEIIDESMIPVPKGVRNAVMRVVAVRGDFEDPLKMSEKCPRIDIQTPARKCQKNVWTMSWPLPRYQINGKKEYPVTS